jgi:hypothetical protein
MTKKRSALAIAFVLAATAFAAVGLATPPSGVLSGLVMARAGFADRDLKFAVKDSYKGAVSHWRERRAGDGRSRS